MKIRKYKLTLKDIILMIILFLFVFNEFLTKNVSGFFSYIEDATMVGIILILVVRLILKRGKINFEKHEKVIIVSYVLIYIIGILGNYVSGFQKNNFAIMVDLLSWTKFFVAYVGLVNIIQKQTANKYYTYLINFAKVIILIGIVLEILNLATSLELTGKTYAKFGIKAFSLFGHPAFASSIFAGFTALLLVEPKKNKLWICLGLILVAATLRSKSFAFVGLVIYSLIFLRKNINTLKILIVGVLVLIIGWSQIQYYFLNPNASRARALSASVEIANDYFPVGSGFATFGTMISGQYYSEAYEEYGLSQRYGFRRDAYNFVADGGWAMIIGQFGYFGTILFVAMIISLILSIKCRITANKGGNIQIIPYIALIGYLLISSTNEAAFNSNYAVLYSIMLAIMVKKQQETGEIHNGKD